MGLPLALIALLSGLVLAALSGDGLNVSPDTVAFYDSATNLADGNGLVLTASYPNLEPTVMGRLDFPLVHWAPLWPALLAGPVALGADAADAARWLLCLLLAANVALFGRLVARLTSDNRAATLTGAVLFALSPAGIPLHADALSEPLFLLLALGGLELLASFIGSERRYLAVSAVVVMALALLTRYAGLPLLGAAFLGLALFGPGSRGRRLALALALPAAAVVPLLAWLARNSSEADTATGRSGASLHVPVGEDLEGAFGAVAAWFAPDRLSPAPRALLALVVLGLIAWGASSALKRPLGGPGRSERDVRMLMLVSFALLYLLALVISRTFFDAANPLDNRGFAPAFMALAAVAVALVSGALERREQLARGARVALVAGVVLVGLAYAQQSFDALRDLRDASAGYGGSELSQSGAAEAVEAADSDTVVYSDGAEALYFLTGRRVESVPVPTDPIADEPNPGYEDALAELRRNAARGRALVIDLDSVDRPFLHSPAELAEEADLSLERRLDGARVYR